MQSGDIQLSRALSASTQRARDTHCVKTSRVRHRHRTFTILSLLEEMSWCGEISNQQFVRPD